MVVTTGIDKLDLADADILVDARAVLLNGQRGLHRTTNGYFLLVQLRHFLWRNSIPRNSERLVETAKKSTRFRQIIVDSQFGNCSQNVQIALISSCLTLFDRAGGN